MSTNTKVRPTAAELNQEKIEHLRVMLEASEAEFVKIERALSGLLAAQKAAKANIDEVLTRNSAVELMKPQDFPGMIRKNRVAFETQQKHYALCSARLFLRMMPESLAVLNGKCSAALFEGQRAREVGDSNTAELCGQEYHIYDQQRQLIIEGRSAAEALAPTFSQRRLREDTIRETRARLIAEDAAVHAKALQAYFASKASDAASADMLFPGVREKHEARFVAWREGGWQWGPAFSDRNWAAPVAGQCRAAKPAKPAAIFTSCWAAKPAGASLAAEHP